MTHTNTPHVVPGTVNAKQYGRYKADGHSPCAPMEWHDAGLRWIPAFRMPFWAVRLFFEIMESQVKLCPHHRQDPWHWVVGLKRLFVPDEHVPARCFQR